MKITQSSGSLSHLKAKKKNRRRCIDDIKEQLLKFIRNNYYRDGRKIRNKTVLQEAERISLNINSTFHTKTLLAKKKIIIRFMPEVRENLLLKPRRSIRNKSSSHEMKIKPCQSNNEGEECSQLCRRKTNCPYKRMVKKQFKQVLTKEKHGKGTCLIMNEDCAKGDFIIEYFGRKVTEKTLQKNGGNGEYYIQVGNRTINGDIKMKNDAKYINHSCNPNCVALVKEIKGKSRVFIFTNKKVKKNTELTLDYNWTVKREEDRTICYCSAGKYCRKYMEKVDKI